MAIFKVEFFSKSFNRIVPITVCLPIETRDELPKVKQPFKTLYLLHGLTSFHSDWMDIVHIPALAQEYGMAIVMPNGENGFYLDDKVRGALYGEFLGKELIEFTREAFNLSDKREDTLIGGLSMGGYGAARNGLKYSDVFGTIIALSAAYITDNLSKIKPSDERPGLSYEYCVHTFGKPDEILGSDVDPKFLAKELIKSNKTLPNYYIACGTEDFLIEQNRDYVKYLNEIEFPHEYVEGKGVHDHNFWHEYIKKALDWHRDLI